jgi:hypothetical protein
MDQRKDGDLQGRALQSYQARYQAWSSPLREELLPPPRIHLELRSISSGPYPSIDDIAIILIFPLSQTWEDPNQSHVETKAKGDNDPLDVCEIGEQVGYTGQVKQVKVLGIMALLDEGETDWKVIVVDVLDPLAPKLNDIEDIERHLPGLIRATNEWFRYFRPFLPYHPFV